MTSINLQCRNINIPWPTKGMGDADYMLAFQHIVMPVAYEFDPDLVISGFSSAGIQSISNPLQSLLGLMLLKAINLVAVSLHRRVMPK